MKLFILIALLPFSMKSQAIVHVGNAGGEAEMTMLKLVPGLTTWAMACNEVKDRCGEKIAFTEIDMKYLKSEVEFFEAHENRQLCELSHVNIVRESLYIKNDIPKNTVELSKILVQSILSCAGWTAEKLARLDFSLSLKSRPFTSYTISVFQSATTDVLYSPEVSQAQDLTIKSTGCANFRITSAVNNYLNLNCLDDHQNYLVLVKQTPNGVEFLSRVDNADLE